MRLKLKSYNIEIFSAKNSAVASFSAALEASVNEMKQN
jgi:hypothetical protein